MNMKITHINTANHYFIDIGEILRWNIFDWQYADKKAILHFRINSNGGDLHTTYSLCERMLKEKRKIITQCYGHAQSGGFNVFCAGDERISEPENIFMLHSGSGDFKASPYNTAEFIKRIHRIYWIDSRRLANISNKPYSYWMSMFRNEKDNYFTGRELKRLGIVTKLI